IPEAASFVVSAASVVLVGGGSPSSPQAVSVSVRPASTAVTSFFMTLGSFPGGLTGYELPEENASTSVKISFLEYCQLFGRFVVDGGGEKFVETLAYSAAEQAQYPTQIGALIPIQGRTRRHLYH